MIYRVSLDLTSKSEREAELHEGVSFAGVTIDGRTVEVSGIEAASADEARTRAIPLAVKLLDMLCSMYDHCLALGKADPAADSNDKVTSALCEAEDGLKTMMIQSGTCVSITHRILSHDASGREVDSWKPGVLPYVHMPAMAFFRMAMLTSSVFHKFQDFYLAIENAASRLHQGLLYGTLLQEALATVYDPKLGVLVAAAMNVNLVCTEADAIERVKKCLWDDFRLGLFHAGKEPVTVVSDPRQEARVAQVIPLAQTVARDMIRAAADNALEAAAKTRA